MHGDDRRHERSLPGNTRLARTHPRLAPPQLQCHGLAAICEQADERDMGFTLDAMRLPLEALGYEIVGVQTVFKIFDKGKVREDKEALLRAEQLGSDLAAALIR